MRAWVRIVSRWKAVMMSEEGEMLPPGVASEARWDFMVCGLRGRIRLVMKRAGVAGWREGATVRSSSVEVSFSRAVVRPVGALKRFLKRGSVGEEEDLGRVVVEVVSGGSGWEVGPSIA